MNEQALKAKAEIRAQLRQCVKQIPEKERLEASKKICNQLALSNLWRDSNSILLYVPLPDEVNISMLMHTSWEANKTVLLPRFLPEIGSYVACRVGNMSEIIPAGRFGISEPAPMCPAFPLKQLDLAIVPGVAFDENGRRLGRGKGFYDRLLKDVRGFKCGVAFDQQIEAEIPQEPHDVILNCVLTPTRWFCVSQVSALQ